MLDLDQWRKDAAEAPDDDSWESRHAWRVGRLVAEVERLNESTMTISWTERATEEACGVSVGLDPLSDVTWTSFYVGVEIRAFFVCLSQWERRVALAEVERLRADIAPIARAVFEPLALHDGCPPLGERIVGAIEQLYQERADARSSAHELAQEVERLRDELAMSDYVPIRVKIDPVLRDYARHAAKAEGLTFSAWVSRAVQQAVSASSVRRAMRDAETRELIEAKGGE